jgi:hypothetical protein
VHVRAAPDGSPARIRGEPVEHLRESWLIEDRWWTDEPLRRRYWEVVTQSGRNITIFHNLIDGLWYRH